MTVRLLIAALLLLTPASRAEEASSQEYKKVLAHELSGPSEAWPGRQFVQADKQGRVFVLRDTLDLYQISPVGRLILKGRFTDDHTSKDRPPITAAAMSLTGSVWVLFSFPNHLDIFRGEKRTEHLEAPWMVSAVSAGQGEPIIAVMPAEMGTAAPTSLRLDSPPLLQEWDGKQWNNLAEGQFAGRRPDGVTRPEHLRGNSDVLLAPTPERHLWMVDEHAYRLRHFSPSGMLKDELTVGGGQVTWKERTPEEWAKAESTAKRAGIAFSRSSLSAVHALTVIRAMAIGRDGAIYLIVEAEKGLALDRFDPGLLTLDRVILAGLDPGSGRLTMAAGRQGLYISGGSHLWQIDSDALEKVEWRPIQDAMLNGQQLVPEVK